MTTPPAGIVVGADDTHHAVKPKVTEDFEGPPTSNDWWSSLIWQFDAKEPYSWEMYPHPLVLKARGDGLAVGYSNEAVVRGASIGFPYERDVVVGLEGLASPDTRVASYTRLGRDGGLALEAAAACARRWVTASPSSTSSARALGARLDRQGRAPQFDENSRTRTTPGRTRRSARRDRDVVRERRRPRHHRRGASDYGLFAPTGRDVDAQGRHVLVDARREGLLLDRRAAGSQASRTPALFQKHAYAFITETRVSWTYDEKKAALTTRFAVKATLKDPAHGLSAEPLLALYRHQWLHTPQKMLPYEYESARAAP